VGEAPFQLPENETPFPVRLFLSLGSSEPFFLTLADETGREAVTLNPGDVFMLPEFKRTSFSVAKAARAQIVFAYVPRTGWKTRVAGY
jgi:hypothetical protein